MATLDDLPIPNFLSLSDESRMQLILDIRLRRGVIIKLAKDPGNPKPKKRRSVAMPTADAVANMTEKQITDLYYALMAKQQTELL